ncbi:hypothetical protein [Tsukamurella sp. 1534]|uniref:hypothetical protein n=1 Tax=Tsukamurella sp. 1534 TaxID=1151061 RepID=UPI000594DE3D|nr:hypothetical protein [Tsukamurella sp. 1534]
MSESTAGLTATETAVLLVLAAEAGPVRNPDLARRGPALDRPSRERLVRRGLLDVEVGARRALTLSLTDRGWAAAADLLEAEPPARATPQLRALLTFAAGLGRYLRRESLALGEVMVPESAAPQSDSATEVDVTERVLAAYRIAAPAAGAWVALKDLRGALPVDLPREAVDGALAALYPEPGVHIVAEDNLKALTAEDRAAALYLGGRYLHAMRVAG